uniref:RGS domain-containing protein n=1 Tax=Spongospora subterranea TaxID=70186 RepID=A0A0H5RC71_9EUKA|eukprot:CRZ11638.1 hypothetical protein [Spongospora subterranea]
MPMRNVSQLRTDATLLKSVVSISLSIMVGHKLKSVVDSTGIKRGLKWMAVIWLSNYAVFLILKRVIESGVAIPDDVVVNLIIFGFHLIFIVGIAHPVHLCMASKKVAMNDGEDVSELENFLKNVVYFNAFYEHARAELCAENLLFFKAASLFRDEATKALDCSCSSPKSRHSTIERGSFRLKLESLTSITGAKSRDHRMMAFDLYKNYLAVGAPLEVDRESIGKTNRH